MSESDISIIAVFVTGGITILGWNVSHYLARRREDRTRRIESSIKFLDRQLEEFYGPLHGIINQIFNVWEVRRRLQEKVPPDKVHQMNLFIWKYYFLPLHIKIRSLLEKKLYLARDSRMELSFKSYLEHSTLELFKHRLIIEENIDTWLVEDLPWPDQFSRDVEEAILSISKERAELLRDLKPINRQTRRRLEG